MRVIIYVEGISDKLAMEVLLRDLIIKKRLNGIDIGFFEAPPGDKKESMINKVPSRAVNILRNGTEDIVIAIPDLYPKNKGFPHNTHEELTIGIENIFKKEWLRKVGLDDARVYERFRVFCFKHDLEALILAAHEALQERLDAQHLVPVWKIPVEEQNGLNPPKYIVEKLFKDHGQRYREKIEAPLILGRADYQVIAERCNQCFKPFVIFLESLIKDGA
ncbi:MAG: DUF4276 family protein [Desulfitobacteriaceae bacterium]